MRADDLMTPDVLTCSPAATLEQAARAMWEHDVGCLVVVDAERHVLGMLTDRDIAMAAYTRGVALRDAWVRNAMSKNVHACPRDASVGEAAHLMQSAQIRRLPVIDASRKLVGLITLGDLARDAMSSPLRMPAIPGVAKTLSAVTERRFANGHAAE
jgi:CBS domain-containing protein